jgi:hypothetical protein
MPPWTRVVGRCTQRVVETEALLELSRTDDELDRLRREAVERAREHGASWKQVGTALGMSRQAAWEFYTGQIRADLVRSTAQSDLSEDEAMELAVNEVRAARRRRRA